MPRVLALLPYPTGRVPGQRYRIEQWTPLMETEGVAVSFRPFLARNDMEFLYERGHRARKTAATLAGYYRRMTRDFAESHDLAFVYREAALLGPTWFEERLLRDDRFVYDFDDAIYLGDASSANAWTRTFKSANKVARLCALARHVTVGNDVLAEFARTHARGVTVIPSTIDTELYKIAGRAPNPRPVVGWTGSVTTVRYLQPLTAAFERIRSVMDYELHVIGGSFKVPGVDVKEVAWSADREVEDLRPLDVGLMPLDDDAWSRGKCSMKALQYMALGIPPVVSPVGANTTLVRDGINGFYARTDNEWADRIVTLLRDPDLRARLGTAARQTVDESYSARVHAPRMARVLREAVG